MGLAIPCEYVCDKQVHPLTNISINLKKANPIEVPLYLYQAQIRANELWNINFSLIDGKHGWTRSNVLGGEVNYSGEYKLAAPLIIAGISC